MRQPTYTPVHNWRNKVNKNGRYKIHIRITYGNLSRYYEVKTPLKVKIDEWTGKDKYWVKNSHPFAFEINKKIKEKLSALDNLVSRYYKAGKSLTFPLIFRSLRKETIQTPFWPILTSI
jgi:hypothetical protein